jgi:hypothetical protein
MGGYVLCTAADEERTLPVRVRMLATVCTLDFAVSGGFLPILELSSSAASITFCTVSSNSRKCCFVMSQ